MYVDESGDTGLVADKSPTRYFCLSGVVVHEVNWQYVHSRLSAFRQRLAQQYHVFMNEELQSAEMIRLTPKLGKSYRALKKYERLSILRQHAEELASIPELNIINIVVDKTTGKPKSAEDVFRFAWYSIFQRFENTIIKGNFPGPQDNVANDRGLIFPDSTNANRLGKYLAQMRISNSLKIKGDYGSFSYVDKPITTIVEEPISRDSRHSYFIQAADCAVFLLKQFLEPTAYMKKNGGNAYFKRLEPVLCKWATRSDTWGIVRV